MQIKTFRAANLQSALADIREQMGPNASVLHTRQVRDGWMGWLGRTRVEVTAGLKDLPAVIGNDVCDASLGNANSNVTATVPPVDARRWSTGAGQGGAAPSGMTSQSVASDEFEQTTEALKSDLIVAGVSDDTAHRWLTSATSFAANMTLRDGGGIEDRGRFWPHLQRAVAREIKLSGPIRTQPGERHIVSLVGPTGVGKTTTVAKLAAEEPAFEVIELDNVDPFVAIALIEQMLDLPGEFDFDEDERDDDDSLPKLDADLDNGRLFVRAKPAQVKEIKEIVAGLS
ncbi:MAG: flagellar biosynthesis protein FlhF, partial [Planctomycetota bacterium]